MAHLPLWQASAALLEAAQASGYPSRLNGESLTAHVHRWLQAERASAGGPVARARLDAAATPAPGAADAPLAIPVAPTPMAPLALPEPITHAEVSSAQTPVPLRIETTNNVDDADEVESEEELEQREGPADEDDESRNDGPSGEPNGEKDGGTNSWAYNRGLRRRERWGDQDMKDRLEKKRLEQPNGPVPRLRVLTTLPLAAELEPDHVHWLWDRRLPLGKLSLIGGAAGTGKSTLAMALVAAVTTGGPWPCGEGAAPRGSAIILSAEDDEHDTIVPRLMAAGADLEQVGLLSNVCENTKRRSLNLRTDVAMPEFAIKELGKVQLLIIDPISAFLGGVDANGNARVRELLQPLATLAARHGIAVVAITHPPKNLSPHPRDHFIGSIAFNAAARASYLVQTDPADENRRLLLQVKNNIATDPGTLAFRITGREVKPGVIGSAVLWEEARSALTAREILARHTRNTAMADAEAFLSTLLKGSGAMQVADIEREARLAGLLRANQPVSQCKPLRDARVALKVSVMREGFGPGARWLWQMSGDQMAG